MWQKCSLVLLLTYLYNMLRYFACMFKGGIFLNTSNLLLNKHLTFNDRKIIEKSLNHNLNFSKIGRELNKPYKTISNEIKRNKTFEYGGSVSWCRQKPCDKIKKPPYVCNACHRRTGCRRKKYYYFADDAQNLYETRRSNSRKGIDMTSSEFKYLNNVVSNGIRNGQSFSMIIRNHKHEFPVGERTLYNYVEKGYLDIINLDLPRKVRYKKRNQNQRTTTKDRKYRIGRTYTNFKDYIKHYNNNDFNNNIVEMDTVEGIKGESVLLTLLWRQSNFMIAIKLDEKDADSVCGFFAYLKGYLGYETFHYLFPIILTDNGSEFSNPYDIEDNGKHVYKTKVFYCDPRHSEQKGKIEKNHEYIRYFIPKGNSFNSYNQDDIDLMINHINSVKRKSLNDDSPYNLMEFFLPKAFKDLLDIEEIKQDDIILNKKLFKYKKDS